MRVSAFVRRLRFPATLLLPLLLAAGCARAVQVEGATRENASILVSNETSNTLLVSYHDGRADHALGTVQPNRSERFIITSREPTITVRAHSLSGTLVSGPHTVTLSPGTTVPVRLR